MTRMVQQPLFDQPTLNVTRPLKEAMNAAVKNCGRSREQIVDRMNDLAERYGIRLAAGNGSRLSLDTFEKWLNPADTSRQISVKALPVFCAAVGDSAAMDVIATPIGRRVIDQDEIRLLEWAKAYHKAKDARQTMRRLEAEL